jgi:hypothetical protein
MMTLTLINCLILFYLVKIEDILTGYSFGYFYATAIDKLRMKII